MGKTLSTIAMTILFVGLAGPVWSQDLDPALVAWWKLDGDLVDASGNGHDGGTFTGDAHFEPGLFGEALALDGSGDYVTITGYTGVAGTQSRTVTAWIQTTGLGAIVAWGENVAGEKWIFRVQNSNGTAGAIRVEVNGGYQVGDTDVRDGEWHHAAAVLTDDGSPNVTEIELYVDGVREGSSASADEPINTASTHDVWIGFDHSSRPFPGLIDELRIYDRVLTADEIEAQALRPKAYAPEPANGTIGVTTPLFTWKPRTTAVFHDVYLGTSPDLGPDDLVSPRWMATMYWHAPGLEPGTTYFWRIDEIDPDGTTYTGDVWSFFATPEQAWQAVPGDGARYMDPNVTLTWMPGLTGISHDVYFGADETEVAEGAGDTFKGNTLETSFVTGDLELEATYYWRIDEVDQGGAKVPGEVWSFQTLPVIPVTDESLVAWWTFEEGSGTRVVDWSGHGAHGDFVGSPQWAAGYEGGALEFGGVSGQRVEMFGYDGVLGTQDRTVTAWIKTAGLGEIVSWGINTDTQKWIFRVQDNNGNAGAIRVEVASGRIVGWTDVRDNEWHHAACILESTGAPTVADIRLYVDGEQEAISDSLVVDVNTAGGRNVWIGDGHHDRPFPGLIDDLRIYNKALTQEELDLVMRIDPLRAWQPHPADNSIADIRTAAPLTWTRGDSASQHDVYLGTDEAAVAGADATDNAGIYRGRFGATSYTPPEGLAWGQEYFWRVDEINADGSTTTGRLWSFVVADYLIVDTFDDYTNDVGQRVFETWIDGIGFTLPEPGNPGNGTGSAVGHDVWSVDSPYLDGTIMETADVYAGALAMPLYYDNTEMPYYSEADRSWTASQDWTFSDVNTLQVAFKGAPVAFLETAPNTFTMSASGVDIWGTADEFRFAYKSLNGNGSIIARVESVENTNAWAKAGVMIREGLEPGGKHAMVVVTPGQGIQFTWRELISGNMTEHSTQGGLAAPYWVKLTRNGNTFTAERSEDGASWVPVTDAAGSSHDVTMIGNVYIGLCLTSHNANAVTVAEFSDVQTTGGVSGVWQVEEVGVDHPANDAADLYVALEDSLGATAVVSYPNGAIVNEWTPWYIPLDGFSGVNLTAVKKMSIGIGNRNNPTPDGAGRVFIDEIRLLRGAPVEPNEIGPGQ